MQYRDQRAWCSSLGKCICLSHQSRWLPTEQNSPTAACHDGKIPYRASQEDDFKALEAAHKRLKTMVTQNVLCKPIILSISGGLGFIIFILAAVFTWQSWFFIQYERRLKQGLIKTQGRGRHHRPRDLWTCHGNARKNSTTGGAKVEALSEQKTAPSNRFHWCR